MPIQKQLGHAALHPKTINAPDREACTSALHRYNAEKAYEHKNEFVALHKQRRTPERVQALADRLLVLYGRFFRCLFNRIADIRDYAARPQDKARMSLHFHQVQSLATALKRLRDSTPEDVRGLHGLRQLRAIADKLVNDLEPFNKKSYADDNRQANHAAFHNYVWSTDNFRQLQAWIVQCMDSPGALRQFRYTSLSAQNDAKRRAVWKEELRRIAKRAAAGLFL